MTALELVQVQAEEAGYQLQQCFANITEENGDAQVHASAMSPRQTLLHLSECYEAFCQHVAGNKFQWGLYNVDDTSIENLKSVWASQREKAIALLATANDDLVRVASAYIIEHDFYHTGQIASFCVALVPDWDAMSIYRM